MCHVRLRSRHSRVTSWAEHAALNAVAARRAPALERMNSDWAVRPTARPPVAPIPRLRHPPPLPSRERRSGRVPPGANALQNAPPPPFIRFPALESEEYLWSPSFFLLFFIAPARSKAEIRTFYFRINGIIQKARKSGSIKDQILFTNSEK